MPKHYTRHQLFIGRSIWACIAVYCVVSVVDWHMSGRPSAEWTVTTLLAIVLGALGFLAANEQVERAIAWMGQTWRTGLGFLASGGLLLAALLLPYPYLQQGITLGADLPLSGIDKANGEAVLRGMQLAVSQENKANQEQGQFPYTFQIRALDDVPDEQGSANAEIGKKNVERLIKDQHVAGVVGPYNTDVALKQLPVINTEQNKIALISPSTTAECLTGPKASSQTRTLYECEAGYLNGRLGQGAFFRLAAPSGKMAEVYVGCLAADQPAAPGRCPGMPHRDGQKYKKAVVIDDGSVFSTGLADSIAHEWNDQSHTPLLFGPRSVGQDRIEANVTSTLDELQARGIAADLVVFIGSYQNSEVFERLLAQYPNLSDADVAYSTSIMNVGIKNHFLSRSSGSRSYYAVAPLISLKDSSNPRAREFLQRYQQEYKTDPNPYSATGYDAATILMEAIKKAEREKTPVPRPNLLQQLMGRASEEAREFRQAVIDKIRDGSDYESAASATGAYGFARDSNGDVHDAKSPAVSVFLWQPDHAGQDSNINGWDFQ